MSRIECYLKCRSQVVYLDGIVSSRCDVLLGGPQCSVLGHLLFLLYNNDLPQSVSSDYRLLVADDVLLLSNIRADHKI